MNSKKVDDVEFLVLQRLKQLLQETPDDKGLLDLRDELQDIVRRNCRYGLQMAALYYLEGREWLGEQVDQDARQVIESVLNKSEKKD